MTTGRVYGVASERRTATRSPATSVVGASARTSRPAPTAARVVSGPIDTAGVVCPSAA